MEKKLLVPDIGDFESVEIVEILVKAGDKIKKNDPIVTLESDKSSVEVPSVDEGIVEKVNIKIGDKVSKGDLLVILKGSNNIEKKTIKVSEEKLPVDTEKIIKEAEDTLAEKKEIETKSIKEENKIENNKTVEKIKKQENEDRIVVADNSDIDPLETKEWIESLNAVVDNSGNERAHFLLRQLIDQSYRK